MVFYILSLAGTRSQLLPRPPSPSCRRGESRGNQQQLITQKDSFDITYGERESVLPATPRQQDLLTNVDLPPLPAVRPGTLRPGVQMSCDMSCDTNV